MGTTKTAIQNGDNPHLIFTIAIEGYTNLITSHDDTAAVVTAWAATDYSACIRGLQRPGVIEQSITPFRPTLDSSSTSFVVFPDDDADTFGVDVFSSDRSTGNHGRLDQSVEPVQGNIGMGDSSDFPSSGAVYIGTERATYATNNGNGVVGGVRGLPAPFGIDSNGRFGRAHRVSQVAGGAVGYPYATDWKRHWVGSWIGCWCQRVVDGVVDTKAESELIFAGRIADLADSESNAVVISCTDAREVTKSTILMGDQFSALPAQKVVAISGTKIRIAADWTTVTAGTPSYNEESDTLEIGVGGYIDAGEVTADEVMTGFNEWYAANGLTDQEWVMYRPDTNRVVVFATNDATDIVTAEIRISMPPELAALLGFDIEAPTDRRPDPPDRGYPRYRSGMVTGATQINTVIVASFAPAQGMALGPFDTTWTVESPTGTFIDQADYIPEPLKTRHNTTSSGEWGFLRIGDFTTLAERTSDTSWKTYWDPRLSQAFGDEQPEPVRFDEEYGRFADNSRFLREDEPLPRVTQVLIMEGELDDVLLRIFASTGSPNYNVSTYDSLDEQLAAAVPWDLLGDAFQNSLADIANFSENKTILMVLEKPTRLADIMLSELALRNAHLVFRDGALQFVTPTTVISNSATHTLTQSHKAAPPSAAADDQPNAIVSRDEIINSIKVEYNRSYDGKYHGTIEVSNEQSKTDFGLAKPLTIKARNTYGLGRGRAGLEDQIRTLVPQLAGDVLKFWGKPIPTVRRSIAASKWFMAPADSVSLTDSFLRDPQTGARGVSAIPCWVLGISQNWQTMSGEVTLAMHGDDASRRGLYSPAAKLASYSAPTITCEASEFSLSSEPADASNFADGDLIYVIERSPATPGSPTVWSRTIDTVSGNDITLTVALSSPAFDATKEYYVISQERSSAASTQQIDAYLGDDVDNKVNDEVRNYLWGTQPTNTEAIAVPVTTNVHEFPVQDGKWKTEDFPCHPAMHRAAAFTANALVNRRTAPQTPIILENDLAINSTDYVVALFPFKFYIGDADSSARTRFLNVGAIMEMSAAGTATVRVTTSALPPESSDAIGGTVEVAFIGPTRSNEITHATTTRTNVGTKQVAVIPVPNQPYTWVTVEAKVTANTLNFGGLHTLWLGPLE